MTQGRLFDPDNPPEAYSKEESNVRLEKIREGLRAQPGWYRYDEIFHDRRQR